MTNYAIIYEALNEGLHEDSIAYANQVYAAIVKKTGNPRYLPLARRTLEEVTFCCSADKLSDVVIKHAKHYMSPEIMVEVEKLETPEYDAIAEHYVLVINHILAELNEKYSLIS